MPCTPAIPLPDAPELPFKVTPPDVPSPSANIPNVCCKLPPIPIPPIPIHIPTTGVLITALREARQAVLKALDLRPLKCPRE